MARKITEAVIIGNGSMGKRHANNLVVMGLKIAARADPRFTHPFDMPSAYDDSMICLEEQAEDRLVVVASPSHLHAQHAMQALFCGAAAVYIEKPMTVNVPDAYDIKELAEKLGVPVTVGYNFRTHPGLHLLLKNIIQPNFFFSAYGIDDPTTWPTYKQFGTESYIYAETGGILWTSSSHAIDMGIVVHGKVDYLIATYDKNKSIVFIRLFHKTGGVSTLYNKWKQHSSRASILSYISLPDTVTVDLLEPNLVDMHYALMADFLKHAPSTAEIVLLPSIDEACHGVEVLVAAEESMKTGEQVKI